MKLQVFINGQPCDGCAILPFKFMDVLDATLDSATLELDRVSTELFEPLTPVRTVIMSNTEEGGEQKLELDWLVATDDSYESSVGSGLYHHMFSLIEETKFLEGFIVDSLCVTHPGGNVYTDNNHPAKPMEE